MNPMQVLYEIKGFLDQGGIALYFIFLMAGVLWILIIERFLYVRFYYMKAQNRLITDWKAHRSHGDADKIRETMKSLFRQKLRTGCEVMNVLITIAPLMGLFGTVCGMIEIFDIIAEIGTGDARAMASGISMATLSTMSGMAVAITGLIFRYKIEAMANRRCIAFNEKLEMA